MARMIAGYMAVSADGYVADRKHGVGWLDPFQGVDTGYQAFIDGIATVVLGRTTYDQVVGFGIGWPYPGKRGFVVTSRPLVDAPEGVAAWHGGVDGLAQVLAAEAGDTWVVGGPALQSAFIVAGRLDRLDLFVMPVFLGGGVPLFTSSARSPRALALEDVERFPEGIVRLRYGMGSGV